MEKVRCTIEGLDCPHCALELSKMLAKHESFHDAQINFGMKTLVLEVDEGFDEEEALDIAQKIAKDFSDDVVIDLRD